MGKSAIGKLLGTARTVKSAIGLAEFFVGKFHKFSDNNAESNRRFLDTYGGRQILYFSKSSSDLLWQRFFEHEDNFRKSRKLKAWISLSEAKIDAIKARLPKSKNKDFWKEHLESWEQHLARCRDELNKIESI